MKVGFVSIIGRPNVGKSTLLNKVLDYKVSITSSTPQTTRDAIKGIYNSDDAQIIFTDTPGIHKPKQKLGESLNKASYDSMADAELILFLQPLDEKIGPGDRFIIDQIKDKKNKVAVMTKLDNSNPAEAKDRAAELKELGFTEVIGVSVNISDSIKAFIDYLKSKMPEGHPFYEQDEVTDVSIRFIAKEIIRETAIENLKEEIPHSVGVMVEEFLMPEENDENRYLIAATIYVERDSQKGIVIGERGRMIKKIGTESREKIQNAFDDKVHLDLSVKVKKKWTSDPKEIKKMGY